MGTEDRINRRDAIAAAVAGRIEAVHENGPTITQTELENMRYHALSQGWADAAEEFKPTHVEKPPLATGCFDYFPDALLAVAEVSAAGNAQHGTKGWDRSKAPDEDNALARHFLKRGTRDHDGQRHRAKVAWRALAALQKEIEDEQVSARHNG